MDRDTIIRLAREIWDTPNWNEAQTERLERFAALVAAAELRRLHAENEALKEALKEAEQLDADANVLAASSSALADSVDKLIAPTPKPEQEPVAWMYDFLNSDNREEVIRNWVTQDPAEIEREKGFNVRPLYTAPTPRKPLTPDQVFAIADQHPVEGFDPEIMAFVRAIERAHGITGETK